MLCKGNILIFGSSIDSMDTTDILSSRHIISGQGLDSSSHRKRLIQFGANIIDVKGSKLYKIALEEVLQLFVNFQ